MLLFWHQWVTSSYKYLYWKHWPLRVFMWCEHCVIFLSPPSQSVFTPRWNATFTWSHVYSDWRPSQTPHRYWMSLKQQAVAMTTSIITVCAIISITILGVDGQVWDESDIHMVLPATPTHQTSENIICTNIHASFTASVYPQSLRIEQRC